MSGNGQSPVLIVVGPTASGKSALAVDVAAEFDGVVINADSMQVYAELPVLTAQPTVAESNRAPHRLYGALSVEDPCSAGRWRDMAVAEIEAARTAGKLPILCGGTGLYIKALMEGLSPIPDIPAAVRDSVRRRLAAEGPEALHAILVERDPVTAARLSPTDRQRVARALEVLEGTGRPLGEWQEETGDGPPADLCFTIILLMPPRDALYADIDARLATMLEEGALEEVEAMLAMDLDPKCPAVKAVGVPEFVQYLLGDSDLDAALAAAQQATRRFAKRQMTWFRNQIIANLTIKKKYSESLRLKTFSFIRENVLTLLG